MKASTVKSSLFKVNGKESSRVKVKSETRVGLTEDGDIAVAATILGFVYLLTEREAVFPFITILGVIVVEVSYVLNAFVVQMSEVEVNTFGSHTVFTASLNVIETVLSERSLGRFDPVKVMFSFPSKFNLVSTIDMSVMAQVTEVSPV